MKLSLYAKCSCGRDVKFIAPPMTVTDGRDVDWEIVVFPCEHCQEVARSAGYDKGALDQLRGEKRGT